MCRLYGFHSSEPTKVECSLVHAQNALLIQSRSDAYGRSHADGWGLASYRGLPPELELEVERREAAAFEDLHFGAAAERIYATTVVAHVRRATVGGPAKANTHPFRYGRWVFAHNGTVADFTNVEKYMAAETNPFFQALRRGTTDSEQTFFWILSKLEREGVKLDEEAPSGVADVLGDAVKRIVEWTSGSAKPSKLNFLLTNGVTMMASRFGNSLYLLERDGVRDCEICGIPHVEHEAGRLYRAVVIASEPITHEGWKTIPDGHVVSVAADLTVRLTSLD